MDCLESTASTGLRDWLADLFRATPLYAMPGRLGAAISAFSPIGPVDPQIVVDFDGIPTSGINPIVPLGIGSVSVGTSGTAAAGCTNTARIYDTAEGSGRAPDLDVQSAQGEVLIIQRRATGPPSDCGAGGTLSLDFSKADAHVVHPRGQVTAVEIKLLDFEESGGSVELFGPTGSLLGVFAAPTVTDGGIATVDLGPTSGVTRIAVHLPGSGAIDDVVVRIEPAP